jgi:hypothetical protein
MKNKTIFGAHKTKSGNEDRRQQNPQSSFVKQFQGQKNNCRRASGRRQIEK